MTINNLQIKIGGEAGMGIMTTGLLFSRLATRGGLQIFAYPEYPSLIRGGHNSFQIYVNDGPATTQIKDVHLLIALNKETFVLHADQLVDGAAVVFDPADFDDATELVIEGKKIISVPVAMSALVKERKGNKVERNTIALGAACALLDFPWQAVEDVIRDWFKTKKPEFVQSNLDLAHAGYDFVGDKNEQFEYQMLPKENPEKRLVITANEAIAIAAIKAGMKFYAAYPMTPSSTILSYLATKENEYNLVVKHTEDEIAAMNMIIGAGFAGVRAMTGTSGGGFALMGEALGMAALAEVPIVTIMGQRPGPSTGLPTWTCQGDLRFVLHSSQGEFPRIVLTPGDAEEAFRMTFDAFNYAEIYQVPVLIVVDKYMQESGQSFDMFDMTGMELQRGKMISQEEVDAIVASGEKYLRYKHTEDGISPRAIPGMHGTRHIGTSYEHDESGYTTEAADETVKQNDKRFRKLEKFIAEHAKGPELFGPENAAVTVVGWGSTKLPAQRMLELAATEGLSINYLHFTFIDPLPVEAVQQAFATAGKTLMVEGNKLGQLEGWIREHTGITMDAHYRAYDGRPFYPEQMLEAARELL